jgi:hypothetical protein
LQRADSMDEFKHIRSVTPKSLRRAASCWDRAIYLTQPTPRNCGGCVSPARLRHRGK